MTTQEASKTVIAEAIEDYRIFKEGKPFDPLGKDIHVLISVEQNYIVFLDKKFYVHWYWNDAYGKFADGSGDVLARVADLEATSTLLLKKPQLEAQRRMLGEALARLLADRTVTHANDMLRKAADFLQARSLERARIWYLTAMIVATLAILLFGWVFWKFQNALLTLLALSPGARRYLSASAWVLSVLYSPFCCVSTNSGQSLAGPEVHYFEGVMRVLVGAFAGAMFVMAVKTNILLSAINDSPNVLTLLVLLSIVAGASEHLLPNLIDRISSILVGATQQLEVVGTGPPNPPNTHGGKPLTPVGKADVPIPPNTVAASAAGEITPGKNAATDESPSSEGLKNPVSEDDAETQMDGKGETVTDKKVEEGA